MPGTRVENFIEGRRVAHGEGGEVLETVNPATGERLGAVRLDDVGNAEAAVRAAAEAFPAWAAFPWI